MRLWPTGNRRKRSPFDGRFVSFAAHPSLGRQLDVLERCVVLWLGCDLYQLTADRFCKALPAFSCCLPVSRHVEIIETLASAETSRHSRPSARRPREIHCRAVQIIGVVCFFFLKKPNSLFKKKKKFCLDDNGAPFQGSSVEKTLAIGERKMKKGFRFRVVCSFLIATMKYTDR